MKIFTCQTRHHLRTRPIQIFNYMHRCKENMKTSFGNLEIAISYDMEKQQKNSRKKLIDF